jgi:uncharacterized coiled-coil DUF342 family protein
MKAGEKTNLVVKFLYDMGHNNIAKRIEESLQHEEITQRYGKKLEEKNLEIMHLRNRIDELNAQVKFMRDVMEKVNGRESFTLENSRTLSFLRDQRPS